ncbi:16S rRNA (cytosine(967)-C(5))-methyltransferase RsmB [Limnochorda pilosa]|uniref:16S rRNA (cytosine(967)-C(5))-methyltransferase n=1 Tax=Limnochorda pilosa TaxID=1555112 RepID=A0A0K2SJZ0_LIMPI|nr:16S rRNA (cytosine(967)-C(5))-methyltransferase RsmB [Limnochorda pilosa]BAS27438.1 16S rRNA methyltransferase [Limnochorda pilosa]
MRHLPASPGPRGASPARQAAARVLLRVERNQAFANRALAAELDRGNLPSRERALATQLVYGTLRWQGRLDGWIGRLAGRASSQLDPATRVILRLAGYQVLILSGVPPEAACDQAVRLAHGLRPQAAGLVNAVCRRMSRREAVDPPAGQEGDRTARLAELHSHPRWLVERWAARVEPPELEAWLEANNRESPVAVRVNRLRSDPDRAAASLVREGFQVEPGALLSEALRVHGGRIGDAAAFRSGWITPQDESSQLAAHLLAPRAHEQVLDLCSAPGGKATHLAELMEDRGRVVAVDLHPGKLRQVEEAARRLGLRSIETQPHDARVLPPEWEGRFDRVLLDAPCSGLGVVGRRPEIRWRSDEETIRSRVPLQQALLARAVRALRGGGRLLYTTCSVEPEETRAQAAWLVEQHPQMVPVARSEVEALLERAGVHGLHPGDGGDVVLLPHRNGTDGFFLALFEKKENPALPARG